MTFHRPKFTVFEVAKDGDQYQITPIDADGSPGAPWKSPELKALVDLEPIPALGPGGDVPPAVQRFRLRWLGDTGVQTLDVWAEPLSPEPLPITT